MKGDINNPIQLDEVVLTANGLELNMPLFQKVTGTLNEKQIDSAGTILLEANKQGIKLRSQLAYIYATAWHESRLSPIKEWGSEAYLKGKKYFPYFGRGFCQLTWDYNYEKEGKRLSIDLLGNPDLALDIDVAANVIVHGMITGSFTGKKLSDYISTNKTDFQNARRIINGTDKMELIAGYASKFMNAIQ